MKHDRHQFDRKEIDRLTQQHNIKATESVLDIYSEMCLIDYMIQQSQGVPPNEIEIRVTMKTAQDYWNSMYKQDEAGQ